MFTALLAAFLSSQTADTALTLHLRARGYHEANPLLTNRTATIVLSKVAYTAGTSALAWKWRKSHPKAARVMLVIGASVATAATIHNARHR